jgi:hypothetical protein
MTRPIRPGALVFLTACALYPGLSMLFQGLYPLVTGEMFFLKGQAGPWIDLAVRMNLPVTLVLGLKTLIGLLWLAGVPGLWAGDSRAVAPVMLAALLSALYPVGPSIMGVLALVCLLRFREDPSQVTA